jgi:phage recombination protein Bet
MTIQVYKERNNMARRSEEYTPEQIDLIKRTVCPGATDDELSLFLYQCKRMQLDPLSKQIYSIARKNKDKRTNQWVETRTIQVGIDGFRTVAQMTGEYAGQTEPLWCGADGKWVDVWLSSDPPAAAKVGVLRKGFSQPLVSVAVFSEFVQKDYEGKPTKFWKNMPSVMIAKVAEAQALRRAFPQQLSGVYIHEEMDQADNPMPAATVSNTKQSNPPVPSQSLKELAAVIQGEMEARIDQIAESLQGPEEPMEHATVRKAMEVFPEASEVEVVHYDDAGIIGALDAAKNKYDLARFYATYKDAVNALGKESRDVVMKEYRRKKTLFEKKGAE